MFRMILWLASYPKSGNTWLRCLLSSYYYTKNGEFKFDLLNNIPQFPAEKFFYKYRNLIKHPSDTIRYWKIEQQKINDKNKFIFLKTHCALSTINNFSFTDAKNSIGAIYIIRDPRNLATSLKNHFQLSYEEAYEFLANKRNSLSTINEDKNSLNFQPLGSWDFHVKSWINYKNFPVLKIRYEDLIDTTFKTFKEVIQFIDNISNSKRVFDRKKAIDCIRNTSFEKLRDMEEKLGFVEANSIKKTKKKIRFFNLGKKNDYNNMLDKNYIVKINNKFKDLLLINNYL